MHTISLFINGMNKSWNMTESTTILFAEIALLLPALEAKGVAILAHIRACAAQAISMDSWIVCRHSRVPPAHRPLPEDWAEGKSLCEQQSIQHRKEGFQTCCENYESNELFRLNFELKKSVVDTNKEGNNNGM